MKIRLDPVLRVYKPIFQKVLILFPDPVIAYFGLLWYQEFIYDHRNSSGLIIEGLHVHCARWSLTVMNKFPILSMPNTSVPMNVKAHKFLIPKEPQKCNHRVREYNWYFLKHRLVEPQYLILSNFHCQYWVHSSNNPNMQFKAKGSKFTFINQRGDP